MYSRAYLEELKPFIWDDGRRTDYDRDTWDNMIVCSLPITATDCDDEDCYDERDALEFFLDLISSMKILVKPTTRLDVGENKTKVKKLNDTLIFDVGDIFDSDILIEDDFFKVEKGELVINREYDNGELADAISDETGYLVYSIDYEIVG